MMLMQPANPCSARLKLLNFAAVRWNGRPTKKLINIMPPIEQIPKMATYTMARVFDSIAGITRSIRAPLPASPWTMPMSTARVLN